MAARRRSHHLPTSRTPPQQTRQAHADACYADGLRHLDARRMPEAMHAFEEALRWDPPPERQAAILLAFGNAARRVGQARKAEDCYDRVLALEPGRHEALINLAALHRARGRYREAELVLNEALADNPVAPELWLSLGQVLREIGEFERARSFYDEALRIAPDHTAALTAMAELLLSLGAFDNAQQFAERARAHQPALAKPRALHALSLLGQGRCAEAWPLYADRFRAQETPLIHTHGLPIWDGQPIPDQRLLIASEDNLRDELLFAGILAKALAHINTAALIVECDGRLVSLFARSFPQATVRPARPRETPTGRILDYSWLDGAGGADCALALGDLPGRLGEIMGAPYLAPDPNETAQGRRWLDRLGPAPWIGLSWRGQNPLGRAHHEFAPLQAWGGLLGAMPGTAICLQPGATAEEIACLEGHSGKCLIRPPGVDTKGTLDAQAALIKSLDAVLSAPTEIAALAAATGTPTFKLAFTGQWTGLGRDGEPFAPACRILKPRRPGDWADVFAQAERALAQL